MTQRDHKHHDHGKQHHGGRKSKPLHKNWVMWLVAGLTLSSLMVGLMLAAMVMYVMSDDEALQPDGKAGQGVPVDSPPVEAAP